MSTIKRAFFIGVFLNLFSLFGFSQTVPSTFSTQYLQFSMGDRSGHSETKDPVNTCTSFALSNNTFIAKDCITNEAWINITLVTVEPLQYFTNNSGWSKRYFGYDPKTPSYQPNGTQILTHVVTLSYNNQKKGYSVLLEIPETYKDVSFVWHFFNL